MHLNEEPVAVFVNGKHAAGFHQVKYNESGLASGVYLYRLRIGKQVLARKMLLMK